MREAVIVGYARTPIGKAHRGSLNMTHGATMAGHAIAAAVERAGIEPGEVEDVTVGCGYPEGATGENIARQSALRAGLPVTTAGLTVNRFCSSGLQAIAIASQQIVAGGSNVMVAAGVESLSLIEGPGKNRSNVEEEWLLQKYPEIYRMSMLQTAEVVARRYGITREQQDAYALQSQRRNASPEQQAILREEIVPITVRRRVVVKGSDEVHEETATLAHDEGARPGTTLEGLAALKAVEPEGSVTAGNASQLSDGAAAVVVVERRFAESRGLKVLGAFRGFAVAGCAPDEMGIGPVFAVPRLLERNGLSIDDIDLWELNEAFASQVLYCRDRLGLPNERFNIHGGAISIGHPYGMSGTRMAGHALLAGRALGAKRAVVTMCIGHGMGAAGLFEILS